MSNKILGYIKVTMYEAEIVVIVDDKHVHDAYSAIIKRGRDLKGDETIYEIVEEALDDKGIIYEIQSYDYEVDVG